MMIELQFGGQAAFVFIAELMIEVQRKWNTRQTIERNDKKMRFKYVCAQQSELKKRLKQAQIIREKIIDLKKNEWTKKRGL